MKSITQFVHTTVRQLALDNAFVSLKKIHPFFSKFIPLPKDYPAPTLRKVHRNGVLFLLDISDFMQWHIYADLADRSWEQALPFLKEDAVILDIGANVGAFSLKLAHAAYTRGLKNVKIIAFEPNPFIIERFQHNLHLNPHLQPFVQLMPFALGAKNEVLTMVFDPRNSGGGSISHDMTMSIKVEVKTLDTLAEEQQFSNLAYIKLDVEGYEPYVMRGAKHLIATHQVPMYIEISPEWFEQRGSSVAEVLADLHANNYTFKKEQQAQFIAYTYQALSEGHRKQYNLLALPPYQA